MSMFNTWDGLEYVDCAVLLGIDHPPGHPLYILLGKVFTLLPFGDPSWNLNLLSAFFGAMTVVVLFLAIREMLKKFYEGWETSLISLLVSLTFGFSYVFWSHCEIPELHTLFLTLIALCVYAAVKWHSTGRQGWLNAAALALALGIGVNVLGTCAVFVPVAIFAFLCVRFRFPRASLRAPLLIFLSGSLLYLYYPIRLARWPVFSHPMNYLGPYGIGTLSWYAWYISGRAWTGGRMFFLHRVVTNIPLYLKFVLWPLPWLPGLPLFLLSMVGVASGFRAAWSLAGAIFSRGRSAAGERLLLPFLLLLFLFLLLPEISIHDPSNPRATDYLMNFFLPSLLALTFFGAHGALKVFLFLRRRSKPACAVFFAALIAVPVYQFAVNFGPCDLRHKNSAYVLSRRTLEQVPGGSVIVSKLVYPQLVAYFSLVEDTIAPDKVAILDPEVVSRDLAAGEGGRDLFARKNHIMLSKIEGYLAGGREVFLAGDVVDEDKSPEKLLLSDLDLELWRLRLTPEERGFTPLRELFLYNVAGLRAASPVKTMPEGCERGIANDGRFSNGIVLLGFRPASSGGAVRRDALPMTLYWTATGDLPGDVYIGMAVLDGRRRRIGEPCWHTLGGTFGAHKWRAGEIVKEEVNIYPPPLAPGRYSIAIWMAGDRGEEVKYLPADYKRTGRVFDSVLITSFDVGRVHY